MKTLIAVFQVKCTDFVLKGIEQSSLGRRACFVRGLWAIPSVNNASLKTAAKPWLLFQKLIVQRKSHQRGNIFTSHLGSHHKRSFSLQENKQVQADQQNRTFFSSSQNADVIPPLSRHLSPSQVLFSLPYPLSDPHVPHSPTPSSITAFQKAHGRRSHHRWRAKTLTSDIHLMDIQLR